MTSDLWQVQVIMSGRDVVVTLWYDDEEAANEEAENLFALKEGGVIVVDDYGQTFMTRAGDFGSVLVKSIAQEAAVIAKAGAVSTLAIPPETV